MARRKKRKSNGAEPDAEAAEAVAESEASIGHNSELTDEQRQALFFSHKRNYEAALAVKKAADADFKNTCKLAKSELGDDAVASIKDAILLDTDEGEAKLMAAMERQMRVARWMNVPFGQQTDLFTDFTDPRPATERARAEGKTAGMQAAPRSPPYDQTVPQFSEWMDGYEEGQRAIFDIQKRADAELFKGDDDPEPLGEAA